MNDKQLDAIRNRYESTTQGEWVYDGMHNEIQVPSSDEFWLIISELRTHPNEKISDEFGHCYNPDFDFIAHAHQDIPDMLNYIEALENRNKAFEYDISLNRTEYCINYKWAGGFIQGCENYSNLPAKVSCSTCTNWWFYQDRFMNGADDE